MALKLRFYEGSIIPVRENGEVALGPLEYVLSNSLSLETQKTYLSIISHIEDICEFFEIDDYEDRISYEEGLDLDELAGINLGLQFLSKDLKKLLKAKRVGTTVDMLFKQWSAGEQASTGVIARKKIVARDYFQCLMRNGDKCLRNYVCPPSFLETRRIAYREFAEILEPPKVDRKQRGTKASLEDLTTLEEFMETYQAEAIWKSEEVSLRNQVMFDLQYWCGLRRGECLSLKLEDMKTKSAFISVTDRRHEDDDPRGLHKPSIKTYQRPVHVPKSVWEKLLKWREVKLDIDEELWDLGLKDRQNDYLFVSLDRRQESFGKPLSLGSVSKAFNLLKVAANVDTPGGSHLLRHLAAMRFVRVRVDAGHDREGIAQELREQFGWAPNSLMPYHYTIREITRRNNEMMSKEHDEYMRRKRERRRKDGY